jgi:hypothetical protein
MKIQYSLDDVGKYEQTSPKKMLGVKIFDARRDVPENESFFGKSRQLWINDTCFCLNAERYYRRDSAIWQITDMLAYHIEKTGLFKTTVRNDVVLDYYLTGKLKYFYSIQEFSQEAATAMLLGGVFGGLIGSAIAGAATSGIKKPAYIIIEINDLALFNSNDEIVAYFGDVKEEYYEEMRADADCLQVYNNINKKLKIFNTQLIEQLKEAVE